MRIAHNTATSDDVTSATPVDPYHTTRGRELKTNFKMATPGQKGFEPIVYTEEELQAMRDVKAKLMEEFGIEESRIGSVFLAIATINSKLRIDETSQKIATLLDILEELDCPDGIDDDLWKPEAISELKIYEPCGADENGASTFWINGQAVVQMEDQRIHCHACIMNFLALHADAKSLREGITFVIDVSKGVPDEKVGNEKQLQNLWQGFPQRPQTIRIAGTNAATRVFVNTSIKLASVVTKQKVLDRIKFCTVDDAKKAIPLESAPRYVGGGAGGAESIGSWVEARLKALPTPAL